MADVLDDGFSREVIRAANHVLYTGEPSEDSSPETAACAAILLKDFDPNTRIEGCSNGAQRFFIHVKPHYPMRRTVQDR